MSALISSAAASMYNFPSIGNICHGFLEDRSRNNVGGVTAPGSPVAFSNQKIQRPTGSVFLDKRGKTGVWGIRPMPSENAKVLPNRELMNEWHHPYVFLMKSQNPMKLRRFLTLDRSLVQGGKSMSCQISPKGPDGPSSRSIAWHISHPESVSRLLHPGLPRVNFLSKMTSPITEILSQLSPSDPFSILPPSIFPILWKKGAECGVPFPFPRPCPDQWHNQNPRTQIFPRALSNSFFSQGLKKCGNSDPCFWHRFTS
ncbi:MAG: hypothetical protein CM15mP66_00020 [Pseudomonadota bacterium]|nr:MAG: hypothetical protein CM15mP66_00020 [Pseudomonadota bacterium]